MRPCLLPWSTYSFPCWNRPIKRRLERRTLSPASRFLPFLLLHHLNPFLIQSAQEHPTLSKSVAELIDKDACANMEAFFHKVWECEAADNMPDANLLPKVSNNLAPVSV